MAITTVHNELIAVNAISGTAIADNAVTSVHIAQNNVGTVQIALNSVTSVSIALNQVTGTQIANNAITSTQLADNAVTATKVPDGTQFALGATTFSGAITGTLATAAQTNITRVGSSLGIGLAPTHNFNLSAAGAVEARFASTDSDCYLQISSDTDEGQSSILQFLSGSSARGSITYDHNTTAASQAMIFKSGDNAVSAMTILGNGTVGIGTTTPANKLHLKAGASGASSFDSRYNLTIEDDGENYIGIFSPNDSYGGVRFVNAASSIRGYIDYYHGTQGDKMQIYAQNHIEFSYPSTGVQHIFKANGKVGIKTNSPISPLHVKEQHAGLSHGYVYADNGISVESDEPMIQLMATDGGTHGGSLLWRYGANVFAAVANPTTDNLDFIYGVTSADDFDVHAGTNMTSHRRSMSIGADGKVLIGTAEAATIGKAIVMAMVFG